MQDRFFEIGGNSLAAMRLFVAIEKNLDRCLPVSSLFEAPTVEELAQLLRADGPAAQRSLVPLKQDGSKPPFFCVPGADGHVFLYQDLARLLDDDRPVYAFQSPGLDGRRPPLRSVEAMASLYVKELQSVQPVGPYFLGGYCHGAFVALEIAQRLTTQGEKVGLVAIFDTDLGAREVASIGGGVARHLRRLRQLTWRRQVRYVLERSSYRWQRTKNTALQWICSFYESRSRAVPRALRGLHVHELSHRAGVRYRLQPYRGRVALFEANGDARPHGDVEGFWRTWIDSNLEVHTVPGGDSSLWVEPSVVGLADTLREVLDR